MSSVVIVLVVIAVAALAAAPFLRRTLRTRRLRARFGPEYDRAVGSHGGDTAAAEHELAERLALHRGLRLTALPQEERARVTEEIRSLQGLFVDDPRRAAAEAERLLQALLDRVGYPAEGRVAALSVDHAERVADYRAARTAVERAEGTNTSTEDLRTALLTVRALARDVLDAGHKAAEPVPADPRGTVPEQPDAMRKPPADPVEPQATAPRAATR